MQPGKLRQAYWLTVIGIVLVGGWLWFGNSGLALLGLWSLARRPWDCAAHDLDLHALSVGDCITSPWRVALSLAGERHEVFCDEMPESEWRRLRRRLQECNGPAQS